MHIELVPTLLEQFREVYEGEVRPGYVWIVDGPREKALFGTIESLPYEQAFAASVPGGRSVAAHVEHLRFALDLTYERLNGKNPPADWANSFNVPAASQAAWDALRREIKRAYDGVLSQLNEQAKTPLADWPPILTVGLVGTIAHNAYHLSAIRQIAQVVQAKQP